jgi:hypothetical protein
VQVGASSANGGILGPVNRIRLGVPSFLGTVKQFTVAASHVPASASLSSLHERVERQLVTVAPIVDANLPHNPPPLGGCGLKNSSSESSSSSAASVRSRASDRFSIITTSRDSLRATHGQPSCITSSWPVWA